jgi:predicted Zn-dependent protease
MATTKRTQLMITAILVAGLAMAACAVNPATGKRQFVLISEQQEIAMGMENDKAISAQLGIYEDPDLQAYVQRLGTRLAADSERPELDWTFRVVDDPIVNAFALPGGYIYVTRGILAHLDNEAALASVIGHEIGHVTARHSVSQISKAQLAQIGLMGATIAAPDKMQQFGQLAQVGMELLFLKYSRDDERQADDLGLRYLVRGEYDPRPMPEVFDMLARVGEAAGAGGVPAWAATHPRPENRSERISGQITTLGKDFSGYAVNRSEFQRMIDGIVYGDDPRHGYFKESLFLHPDMRFRLQFPEGWKLANQTQAVVGISSEEDAIVQLTMVDEPSAAAALQKFRGMEGVTETAGWDRSYSGLDSAGIYFAVPREQNSLRGMVAYIEHDDRVFQLLGYTMQDRWNGYHSAMVRSMESFAILTERRYIDVEPKRLRIIRPGSSMSIEQFAGRYDSSVPAEELALINGIEPGERIRSGNSYKVVQGGRLP